MKRRYMKRILSIIMTLCIVVSALPPLTIAVDAEESDDKTSMEIAGGWGFDTSQPENSKEREALGENPIQAYEDTVTIFGEVPLEIAVVGSSISLYDDYRIHNEEERGDIYYYDNIEARQYSHKLQIGSGGGYDNVRDITWASERDVRPATTVAVDMDGDGVDEIVRYFIDINYNGSDINKHDGDIKDFNAGVEGYSADFRLQCINSQTGTNIDRLKLRTVSKTTIPDFFIPDSIYYWSSYMQITAGDYDGDGKEEIAIAVPGSSRSYGNIYIYGMEDGRLVQEYSSETIFYSCFGGKDNQKQFTAIHLASGDADNDKIDELIYTHTRDLLTVDENSTMRIIDYKNGAYTSEASRTIKFGNNEINEHLVGNAGVTVGDIDNDGLNEVIVGGFMVNKNEQDAIYTFTKEDGTTVEFEFYHELAMSYMKYDKNSKAYGNFKGFTVFREEEDTAWTAARGNDTKYNGDPALKLSSSARYRNAQNWTIPIQSVSLTGYVNGRTNDQIFFGNCMYYYDVGSGKFNVYNDSGKADSSTVAYNSFDAPVSAITSLIPGSFLAPGEAYVKSEGREQLLISYASKNSLDHNHHFEIAMMYESSAGTSMDVQKKVNYLARTGSDNFYQLDFYPTVCAPNMDNDAVFVQYIGYAFTYSKPEILTVLASMPYYEDIYNAYPIWEPGSTYLSKSSGTSQTDTGFTEFSLGWYLSFEQDISFLGLKIASFEMEVNVSANISHEYSHTIERESSVTYETNGGQDSVVMVSSPLDMYYYRYYEENTAYKTAYPHAVKSDPTTWGTMAVSLPSAPQTLVFPVERYNELAENHGMDIIDSNFWIHTSGDPGTYPTSVSQFKNAVNILSSDSSISATSGSGSVTTELTISESTEDAYTVSLTMGARAGAGAGGFTMGVTFENTLGFGGARASFRGTTIGATIMNFPGDDYDTSKYSLTTRLHSYVTEFNGKNIMVLYYTVSQVMGLPKLPDNFHAAGRTAGSISLAWEVPEIISYALRPNNFELHRYDNYYKKWFVLDDSISVQPGTNFYTDTDVYPSEFYKYRLIAEDVTGSRTNSVTLEASTLPTGAPPVIVLQPRDTKAGAGYSAAFGVVAELPENIDPARLYYQWYQRKSDGDSWSAVSGANEKTLTLSCVSLDMNGYRYYCEVTRLINNNFPLTADSDIAKLTVTEQPPRLYTISYSAGINGSVSALEAAYGGNYSISSGNRLYEQTKVEFTASPNIGYRVNQWTINEIPVEGCTGNNLTIDSLSEDITVNVSFTYSTYDITFDIAENKEEGQGNAVWGEISAKYAGTYVLPQGEATSVAAQMPVTFTAAPAIIGDIKYTVKQWTVNGETLKNDNGSIFIGKTYTIEALSEDTAVEVMFAKAVEYNISAASEISNTDVAYSDNGTITVRDDGALIQEGDAIERGSRVTIDVVPPSSALIYSWEITPVDKDGNATAPTTVLGSQSSYVFDELSCSYKIKITYVIISTKTVTFGSEGGGGTVTAAVGVGNTSDTGTVVSGGKVQMYSDVVFTAVPDNYALGVKGWTVNGIYETNTATSITLEGINRNTAVKALFETAPEAKDSIAAVEINAGESASAVIDADAIAFDIDGDSLIVSGIRTPPEAGTAAVKLGEGENYGKAIITGVNKGEGSAVFTVSDGKGHNCDVSLAIRVSNNPQNEPDGLNGIGPTSNNGNDGKITGLIAGKTYQYKEATSEAYKIMAATEEICEITGLTAGTYLVRYAAVTGYDAGKSAEIVVPQYVSNSIACLEELSYKVGAAEKTEVPSFDKDTVAYNVELDYGVGNGTEIILFGIPAEGSGAAVTESVYGTLKAGTATAKIKVTSEDEVSNKTYTVNFITGEAPNSEARILEFKINVNGITAVGTIDDAAKTIAVTVPKGTDISNLTADFVLSDGAICLTTEKNFTKPVPYTIKAEDGTEEEYTVTVTEAGTGILYYNLNVGIDEECKSMGRVIGGGSYEAGQEVTIAAFSAIGYKFTVWEMVYGESSTIDINEYSNTFSMPAIDGITVNALFEAKDDPGAIPISESFDKYDNYEDDKLCKGTAAFTVDKGDYVFTGITGMTEDEDYTADADTITITNSTLQSLEPGLHNLVFNFSEGKKAGATLEIMDSRPVVYSVLVNPATAIVTQGKTKKFSAVLSGENCGSVKWSVTGKGGGTDTDISAEGLLTVDADEAEETVLTITATSDIDTSKSGTAKATIIGKVDAVKPVFVTDLETAAVTYNEGEAAAELTVKATVTDEGTVGYQWYENTENSTEGGTKIADADSASYTPPTRNVGIKYYYAVAVNENPEATGNTTATETSRIIPVEVKALVHAAVPELSPITGKKFYKQGDSISAEDMLKITAASPDGGSISYKWYLKAAEENDPDILLDGGNDYYIPSTAVEGTFTYYVTVTNTNNNEKITGNTTAAVTSEPIEVNIAAVINAAQPYFKEGGNLSGTFDYPVGGSAASLTIEATADDLTGGGRLSYQWYVNTIKSTEGGIKVGTDSASYTPDISGLGADTTRYCYVVVTNTNNTVNGIKSANITSGIKTICIKEKVDAAAPVIEQQSSGTYTYYKGTKANSLEIYAVSGDGGSISYQWYVNSIDSNTGGETIAGETGRICRPSTDIIGTTYYYPVATNTNTGVNGRQTAEAAGEVSTIRVVQPEYKGIAVQPLPITGVPYGTGATAASFGLPGEISINISIDGIPDTDTAPITWSLTGYNTSITAAQTFNAIGTINLPTGVLNTDKISLEAVVSVSVNAKPPEGGSGDSGGGNGSSGGGGGGSGGGGSGGSSPTTTLPVIEVYINVQGVKMSAAVDSNTKSVKAELDRSILDKAFLNTTAGENGEKTIVVEMPASESGSYDIGFPTEALTSAEKDQNIVINTDTANLTIPNTMLTGTGYEGSKQAEIAIKKGNKDMLPQEIKDKLRDKPLIELSMTIDGKQQSWDNTDAPVMVSIAYTPAPEELKDPEHITIWYIDGAGNIVSVSGGRYDPATGRVTFSTTHFSRYAVVYVRKTFSDISSYGWAKKQIEVLASKGIISTAGKVFNPGTGITRADYLAMLVRALGLSADFTTNFDDVKPGDYYWKEIGTARKLGITSGIGNNEFNPSATITRQDMMSLTERALRNMKIISREGSAADLEKYEDKDSIAAYAKESMAALVRKGLIEGSGGRINPLSDTTRAEAAVFIYRIYNIR